MSAWLTRALAYEDASPCSDSAVCSERSALGQAEDPNGAIGAIGTVPPVLGEGPSIPAAYRAAYADLCAACPVGVPEPRWQLALADAERFLVEWGDAAAGLGWPAADLFGLHPTVPLSRVDCMGLCWLLKGERVMLLSEREARFERGFTFRRPPAATAAVPCSSICTP